MITSGSERRIVKPSMNVFTVGMDEKPPVKTPLESPPSPPPSYCAKNASQELGGCPPIIIKKKSSFKTPLLWILGIFLVLFLLITISEISYNRHKDERYFKLRWAELRHRMGLDRPFLSGDNFNNFHSLRRVDEFDDRIVPVNSALKAERELKSETQETTVAAPVVAKEVITKSEDSKEDNSVAEPPQLQFLRNFLQNVIKSTGEGMPEGGTISVHLIKLDDKDENNKKVESKESSEEAFDRPIFEPPQFTDYDKNNNQVWNRPQPSFFHDRFQDNEDNEQSGFDMQKFRFAQIVRDIIARRMQQAALMEAIQRQQQMQFAAQQDNERSFFPPQQFMGNQQESFSPFQQQQQQQQQQQPQQQQQQQFFGNHPFANQQVFFQNQEPQMQEFNNNQQVPFNNGPQQAGIFTPQQQPQQTLNQGKVDESPQQLDTSKMIQFPQAPNQQFQQEQPSDAVWNKQIVASQPDTIFQSNEFPTSNKEDTKTQVEDTKDSEVVPVKLSVLNDEPSETVHNDFPQFQHKFFQVDDPVVTPQ